MAAAATLLPSCHGIFDGIYDEPLPEPTVTVAGKLYIDASDWTKWYYIDLKSVAEAQLADSTYDSSTAWQMREIPLEKSDVTDGPDGIYTYWYDVFGAGISVNEFRSFMPTAPQENPEVWTIAVHRNNVRTNGASAAATDYSDIDEVPSDMAYLSRLDFKEDCWNENEVWCVQDQMLLGLIGNQGIDINPVLSSWLKIDIPPMPPAFTLNSKVFVVHFTDDSYGAIQLENYQSSTGTKCCLSINYRYPL